MYRLLCVDALYVACICHGVIHVALRCTALLRYVLIVVALQCFALRCFALALFCFVFRRSPIPIGKKQGSSNDWLSLRSSTNDTTGIRNWSAVAADAQRCVCACICMSNQVYSRVHAHTGIRNGHAISLQLE